MPADKGYKAKDNPIQSSESRSLTVKKPKSKLKRKGKKAGKY